MMHETIHCLGSQRIFGKYHTNEREPIFSIICKTLSKFYVMGDEST